MKKNKLTEFFKGKGYYVLLFVGVFAIAAVAIIGSNLSSKKEDVGEDYLDLNETDNNMVTDNYEDFFAKDDDETEDDKDDIDLAEKEKPEENDSLLELDVFTEDEEDGVELAQGADDETETETEEPDAIETAGLTFQPKDSALMESLSFGPEQELLWPVVGNVIRNYSMDHVVYYPTLMQYKCSPAIVIDAEVGTEVEAAARGIVTEIETSEETGLTVTTEIGDGYSLVYGQLKDVDLEIGDKVSEGQAIGQIAEPTKYYIVEGSNLYFQILKEEETINPMLFLE